MTDTLRHLGFPTPIPLLPATTMPSPDFHAPLHLGLWTFGYSGSVRRCWRYSWTWVRFLVGITRPVASSTRTAGRAALGGSPDLPSRTLAAQPPEPHPATPPTAPRLPQDYWFHPGRPTRATTLTPHTVLRAEHTHPHTRTTHPPPPHLPRHPMTFTTLPTHGTFTHPHPHPGTHPHPFIPAWLRSASSQFAYPIGTTWDCIHIWTPGWFGSLTCH